MSWMNASAAAAADRRNAELSAWDHSVESPDGKGRRNDAPGAGLPPVKTEEEQAAYLAAWEVGRAERLAAAEAFAAAEEARWNAIAASATAEREAEAANLAAMMEDGEY